MEFCGRYIPLPPSWTDRPCTVTGDTYTHLNQGTGKASPSGQQTGPLANEAPQLREAFRPLTIYYHKGDFDPGYKRSLLET